MRADHPRRPFPAVRTRRLNDLTTNGKPEGHRRRAAEGERVGFHSLSHNMLSG